ncbi:regulatory protein zeste-like [Drosophila nasuta]|uniref:regulatory protein zeste-like n=1 Tax=Drosophila nasuta TaxID=42062 RepID=UPI00295F2B9B|nr:regulatory protein zeste-like [Drosophila nasuta]
MAHPNGVFTYTSSVPILAVQVPRATATTPTDVQGGGRGGTTGGGENENYDERRNYFRMKKAESELKELAIEAKRFEVSKASLAIENMRQGATIKEKEEEDLFLQVFLIILLYIVPPRFLIATQIHTMATITAGGYNQQIISEIKPQQITLAQYSPSNWRNNSWRHSSNSW